METKDQYSASTLKKLILDTIRMKCSLNRSSLLMTPIMKRSAG